MRTIKLEHDGRDGNRVLARMYSPDSDAQAAWLLDEFNALLEGTASTAQRPLGFAKGDHDQLREISERGWKGAMAGEVLVRLAVMREAEVEEPSVNKAVASVSKDAVRLRQDENGESIDQPPFNVIAKSDRSYWKYYTDYKHVRHFWAAHRVLEQSTPFYAAHLALAEPERLEQFLGWAAWFMDLSVGYRSRNDQADSIVDPNHLWTVEPRVGPIKPELPAITSTLELDLSNYRAPMRKR